MLRDELINQVINDSNFKRICYKINRQYGDDLYQETCYELLTIPEDRLPEMKYLNFWWYRVAFNISTHRGRIRDILHERVDEFSVDENRKEQLLKEAEKFMLTLSEFENRIVHLLKEHGTVAEVARLTGIGYQVIRSVKDKLKKKAEEI